MGSPSRPGLPHRDQWPLLPVAAGRGAGKLPHVSAQEGPAPGQLRPRRQDCVHPGSSLCPRMWSPQLATTLICAETTVPPRPYPSGCFWPKKETDLGGFSPFISAPGLPGDGGGAPRVLISSKNNHRLFGCLVFRCLRLSPTPHFWQPTRGRRGLVAGPG